MLKEIAVAGYLGTIWYSFKLACSYLGFVDPKKHSNYTEEKVLFMNKCLMFFYMALSLLGPVAWCSLKLSQIQYSKLGGE